MLRRNRASSEKARATKNHGVSVAGVLPGRWLAALIAGASYVLVFKLVYIHVGRLAFVCGIMAPALVVSIAGLGPGLLTALVVQISNPLLVRWVGLVEPAPGLKVAMSTALTAIPFAATAGLRFLLQRVTQINQRLDEQMALHQNLVSSMGEGVAVFDREDRFLFANGAAEQLFGVERGVLIGRKLAEFLAPEAITQLERTELRDSASRVCYDLRLAGDESRTLLVTQTRTVYGTSSEVRTLRVLRDVTARERLERERLELEQYLQRTEALQSLAVLAGGVAHDFNNLLSGVIGSTDLGLLRLTKSPTQARECIEDARRFAIEASELSRKMLAYAGKRNLVLTPLDLAGEVRESLRLVNSTATSKATLINEIPDNLPKIHADRTGFHQVFTNLVLNAVEAMSNGSRGRLRLRAFRQTIDRGSLDFPKLATAPSPGDYVVLSVADDGVGMSEETRAHLFEPFFSTKFQGRGMGLAATWGIVKAHRGGIVVESRSGEGSTFLVYWPVAVEPVVRGPVVADDERDPLVGATVLLVDDDAKVRRVSRGLLEELGCAVVEAGNGPEAIGWLERLGKPIDLVLLDLTMPEQSGLEVLEELRAREPRIRAILTSGYSDRELAAYLQRPGVVGVLPKPHILEALKSAIREGLDRSR
jgi:two-component system, cell cycle sensor histidine kinase and response regulator CckA